MLSIFFSHLHNDTELIKLARKAGLDGADCSANDLAERPAPEMKRFLSDNGLLCAAVYGSADLANRSNDKFSAGIDAARRMLADADALGAKNVMLVPGFAESEADKPRAASRIAECLNALVPDARSAGITLSIENFSQLLTPYSSPGEIISLLGAVPGLAFTFDTGNFRCRSITLGSALETLLSRTSRVHAKDWGGVRRGADPFTASDGAKLYGAPLGLGELPLRETCRTITDSDFRGDWCIEMNCMDVRAEDVLESVRFMREFVR